MIWNRFKGEGGMKKGVLYFVALLGLVLILGNLGLSNIYAQGEEKPEPLALDGTEWAVQMSYTDAQGEQKTSSDKLIFKDGRFNSENQEGGGFKDSNYTLSAKGDATVFETMQSKDDKDRAFWRGEVRESNVRGILSTHHYKGENKEVKDYTFGGALASGIIKETEKARKDRLAAEKAAEEAKERVAREAAREAARVAAEKAAKQAEGSRAKAAQAAEKVATKPAPETSTGTAEQSFVEKIKSWWNKVTGKAQ